MSKIKNANLYFLMATMLFGFTMLLNVSNKIVGCALIFALITIVANFMAEVFGKNKTMLTLAACSLLGLVLLWNNNYYISGVKVDILFGSFAALMISAYFGISAFLKFKSNNFHVRNFIGLAVASVVDSLVMNAVLINKFSAGKLASIFISDILVKFSYSAMACLIMFACAYLLQDKSILKN